MKGLLTSVPKDLLRVLRPRPTPGDIPGTLRAEEDAEPTHVHLMAYGSDGIQEKDNATLDDIRECMDKHDRIWVNVDGLRDVSQIEEIGKFFGIHGLALEDVVATSQRPKLEEYEEYLYIVVRMVSVTGDFRFEQISIFIGKNYVLTFQEHQGDFFDPVRDRLRKNRGRIRKAGPDYLAYALLDVVVDHYFPLLDLLDKQVDQFEDAVLHHRASRLLTEIHVVKRQIRLVRHISRPLSEVLKGLMLEERAFVESETVVYLRDCLDHNARVQDLSETLDGHINDVISLYLSTISHNSNEVMKVLTILAAIFIPMTFIAGIYGMNFDPDASPWNMPELDWYYGYPYAVGLMLVVAPILLLLFRKKKWI